MTLTTESETRPARTVYSERPDVVVYNRDEIVALVTDQRAKDEAAGIPVTNLVEEDHRLRIQRVYTTEGVDPYDACEWEIRDILLKNWRDNTINFQQDGVEVPKHWSVNAANIVVSKYFRGNIGKPGREQSVRSLIDRVVLTYVEAARVNGYIHPDDLEIFEAELKYCLVNQIFAFNSPVWFNVGAARREQQVSACFILAVEDTLDSVLNWYREEGLIFKGGSGAGLNLSKLRSSKESLSTGGRASGPVSFMRGADSSAGTISSGGATRRAAKMVVLDVDHPDIEEFVETKRHEEDKIRILRDGGFDMDLGGSDITSVQYQNANNSVRVSDAFMEAVEADGPWETRARKSDDTYPVEGGAVGLFDRIARAAWECADPGIQYDDTINDWHTNPESGRITASNPCSEYLSLDNTSCNLASLNLIKFLKDDGTFDAPLFAKTVEILITAMEISVSFGDFPTEAITRNSKEYRQLGIGYANLGAYLMATGKAYDSDEGRATAAAITSLMTGTSYRRSAELAGIVGPYAGFARNAKPHTRVMRKHLDAHRKVVALSPGDQAILDEATHAWEQNLVIGDEHGNGWRNAQASVLAPTGTIGFMMDCDTTGVEPDFALAKDKKLVGGGSMIIVNQSVGRALKYLGYNEPEIDSIKEYIKTNGHVIDAPGLSREHYSVFDCAVGDRSSITADGHILMMAAVQPFISGSISKTVNLPKSATVEDIKQTYLKGWKLGLKAIAVYRDECKVGQPLSSAGPKAEVVPVPVPAAVVPTRKRLPKERAATVRSFTVGALKGYLIASRHEDGELGEVFIKTAKQGSVLAGVFDALSIDFSMGRQYGVPLEVILSKYIGMSFEPAGMTDDPEIRIAKSVMDYIGRRLALDFLPFETRKDLNVFTSEERTRYNDTGSYLLSEDEIEIAVAEASTLVQPPAGITVVKEIVAQELSVASPGAELALMGSSTHTEICVSCGTAMRPAGSCFVCESCGSTSGCS